MLKHAISNKYAAGGENKSKITKSIYKKKTNWTPFFSPNYRQQRHKDTAFET